MVADGAAILAELDTKLLQKLYDRKIRISVSNLDLPPSLPGFMKEGVKGVVDAAVAPKFDMDLEMMFEKDGKPGRLQVSAVYTICAYIIHCMKYKVSFLSHLIAGRRNC